MILYYVNLKKMVNAICQVWDKMIILILENILYSAGSMTYAHRAKAQNVTT